MFQPKALALAVLLTMTASAALAQDSGSFPSSPPYSSSQPPFPGMQGTPEDQKACSPDVQRHCKDAIPDTFRILSCLQNNRSRISTACQATLTRYGQ